MANLIREIEQVKRYIRLGYPEGVEPLQKMTGQLLARINQLELALIPFARIGSRPSKDNLPLVQVYYKDCHAAYDQMMTDQPLPPE